MSAQSNKADVRRWIEAMNSANWADSVPDDAAWKQEHVLFRTAFPDYQFTAEHIVAEDDMVMIWGSVSATHLAEYPIGELQGIAPTGKRLTWTEVQLLRYEHGEVIEAHLLVDTLGRLQQLGVHPADPTT